MDWTEAVRAVTEKTKNWHPSQRPRNVVDENVLLAEEHSWSENGVRQTAFFECSFDFRLAPEIRKGRCERGIRNADVNDPLNAGGLGGFEQDPAVDHRVIVVEKSVVESDPVCVVEDRHSVERRGEVIRFPEIKRECLNLSRQLRVTFDRTGQGDDFATFVEQMGRDVSPRISERPGNRVDGFHVRLPTICLVSIFNIY
jgi:hypothetical protein